MYKKTFIKPAFEIIEIDFDSHSLDNSPLVRPGGGGGGNVSVVPPTADEEDTEVSG